MLADSRVGALSSAQASEALEWWHARAMAGDPEGHLVVGWLGRHGLVAQESGSYGNERPYGPCDGHLARSRLDDEAAIVRILSLFGL